MLRCCCLYEQEREWSGRSHEGKGKEKGKKQQRPASELQSQIAL